MNERALAKPGVNTPGAHLVAKYHQRLAHDEDGQPINPVREWSEYSSPELVTERRDLIPREDLPQLIEALKATIRPASRKELAGAIALIAVSWPHAHQKADPAVLDAHTRILAEDLAEFPADILAETIGELRRSLRFPPAISEIFLPANKMMIERSARLRLAEQHLREHERRDAILRRSEEHREREREAHQEWLARAAKVLDATSDEVDQAHHAIQEAVGLLGAAEWRVAMDRGEAWPRATYRAFCAMTPDVFVEILRNAWDRARGETREAFSIESDSASHVGGEGPATDELDCGMME